MDKPLYKAIIDGDHDQVLDQILQAVSYRKKMLFRPGAKVRLTGTRNVEIDGRIGTVIKVNAKRIAVGLGEATSEYGRIYYPDGEYNVPVSMLEVVQ